jgi:methyl-accepting chemotaxis protein
VQQTLGRINELASAADQRASTAPQLHKFSTDSVPDVIKSEQIQPAGAHRAIEAARAGCEQGRVLAVVAGW